MTDNKITSLVDRLKAKAAEKKPYFDHMDRIYAAIGILAEAIEIMRDAGATQSEIAGVLRHAADELTSSS